MDSNTQVTISIDDPGTGSNPDISQSITVDSGGYGTSYFGSIFDIQAGQTVSVTDGGVTKTHIVTILQINSINIDTETVSGTAAGLTA